ncbi:MAG: PLP-dependent transferase [Bradymonadales bacterium]|nr:MAG: PLP-dependent transferase [Bradymonadales bacterium]
MTDSEFEFATRAIHAGQAPDPSTGAIMTPVFQSSTFVQESPGKHKGYEYARTQNPTRKALEENLASLEAASAGICFSSGCAAANAMMMSFGPGDHFIVADDVYGGTFRIFDKVMRRFGQEFDYADLRKISELDRLRKQNTKMIWLESPTNPLLKIFDIKRISQWAKEHGILVLVDNTFMSPALQNPLLLGADFVLHSTTKYIGGHSDVVGGFIGTNLPDWAEKLRFLQNTLGGVPAPWDCFLCLRGSKTLALRMAQHSKNALEIAKRLERHPKVERVMYPGLESHPDFQVASQQMKDFGGMLSFVLKSNLQGATSFLESTKIFSLAESLGGVESLIEHPAIMTHASIPREMREKIGVSDSLIRLSVGIEALEDLWKDLDQAFEKVK